MNWLRWIGLCVAVVLVAVGCANAEEGGEKPGEEETVVIPLDEIWSGMMPGTNPFYKVFKSELRNISARKHLQAIERSLKNLKSNEQCGSAFVVQGHGFEAILEANKVFTNGGTPPTHYPAGKPLTAVFFAHPGGRHVNINRVSVASNKIEIHYKIASNTIGGFTSLELTRHIAFIPLQPLDYETLEIKVVDPPDATASDFRRICRSATFRRAAEPLHNSQKVPEKTLGETR